MNVVVEGREAEIRQEQDFDPQNKKLSQGTQY